MSRTYRVNVYRTFFFPDGDYYNAPHTHTFEDYFEGTAAELAREIRKEGLTFDASGGEWAANPDGSCVSNYATGERCEVSAHLPADMPARLANALRRVVDGK